MTQMKLIFLLLRKNAKLLNEYVKAPTTAREVSQRRKYIIGLKESLAELSTNKYNMLKAVANDIDRFRIMEPSKDFTRSKYDNDREVIRIVIPGTDIVLREYDQHSLRSSIMRGALDLDHQNHNPVKIIHDKQLNIYFVLYTDRVEVDKIVLFENHDYHWFCQIIGTLSDAKEAEEEVIKQRRILEEQQKELRKKENILAKYS